MHIERGVVGSGVLKGLLQDLEQTSRSAISEAATSFLTLRRPSCSAASRVQGEQQPPRTHKFLERTMIYGASFSAFPGAVLTILQRA
jgi:hypothetical protein